MDLPELTHPGFAYAPEALRASVRATHEALSATLHFRAGEPLAHGLPVFA